MKRNVAGLMLLVTFLAGNAAARAETITGELTLDQALAMARKRNRGLVAERARLAQAQTSVEQAWTALFPVVAGQAKYTHNYKEVRINFGDASSSTWAPP